MTGPLRASAVRSLALTLLSMFLSTASAQTTYTITDLGTLGGGKLSVGQGISSLGQVTGNSLTSPHNNNFHAFLYSDGKMRDLGALPGYTSSAGASVNSHGQVTGKVDNATGLSHAFLYQAGGMTDLGTLGGSLSSGQGINNAGQVTGYANLPGDTAAHAFLYSNGAMTDLGTLSGYNYSLGQAINEAGQVTGYVQTIIGFSHPFLYSGGTMTDLGTLGGNFAAGLAINASGQVTGYSSGPVPGTDGIHAFLYSGGTMTDLGSLTGETGQSRGQGINGAGQVVGWSVADLNSPTTAFLYTAEDGMVDLNSLLPARSRWVLYNATGINDAGQITGAGIDPRGDSHALLLTPPPFITLVNLIKSQNLPLDLKNSLLEELNDARGAGTGSGAYCSDLKEFILNVRSLAGTYLTASQARQWIALALRLRSNASCY